ncbi:MAG: GNAT family N-acetyltransferase [Microlunatus sp.]|nr:GNAT family N-acetyltransferase [Microlunatus sp.]
MIMLTIDTATGTDLDAIMELEAAGFPVGERWSRDSWQHQLSHPSLAVLAARDDRLRGVIALRIGPDLCDLDRVIVDPGSRRRGIARTLVAAGLRLAANNGVPEMILEVRSDNAPAIALYRSYRFEAINVRSNYYGPGRDALIMKRETHE